MNTDLLSPGEPITTSLCTRVKNEKMPFPHAHGTYEIYYLDSGSVTYRVGQKSYDLAEGDLIVIPPGEMHNTYYPKYDQSYRMEIQLSPDYLGDCQKEILPGLSGNRHYAIPEKIRDKVKTLIEAIDRELYGRTQSYSEELIKSYVTELLIFLHRYALPVTKTKSQNLLPTLLLDYIEEHYAEDLSNDHLARMFFCSESTVFKTVKACTGKTVREYLTEVRIKHAGHYLREGGLPVTKIAGLVGFNDSNYFSHVFRKTTGLTPTAFAGRYQK